MRATLIAAFALWTLSAADEGVAVPKVLPLGDSITDGDAHHDSYRRELWHLLRVAGLNADFIGSRRLNGYFDDRPPHADFDQDHEGHRGWTSGDIIAGPSGWDEQRGNLREWLKAYTPDIVLLHIGTGDVLNCTSVAEIVRNVQNIVELIRRDNPRARIFVAQIIPVGDAAQLGFADTYCPGGRKLNESVRDLNTELAATLPQDMVVDLYREIDPGTDLEDGIHPNALGEQKLAQAWFTVLRAVLSGHASLQSGLVNSN
jgi:lysophospholipase L1-like esterase